MCIGWNVPRPTCSVTYPISAPAWHRPGSGSEVQPRVGAATDPFSLATPSGSARDRSAHPAPDVRRQRHVPIRSSCSSTRLQSVCARPTRQRSRISASWSSNTTISPIASCGQDEPAPADPGGRGDWLSRNTSTEPLKYSARFGLFLPIGSDRVPARWPYNLDGITLNC